MKKVLLLLMMTLAALANVNAASVETDGEIVAGMNVAYYDLSNCSSRIGFHAGFRVNFGLPSVHQGLYANGAVLLSLRGSKIGNMTLNPFYMDVPIHLGYRYRVSDDVALLGEFGPYVGIGLFGKTKGIDVFSAEGGLRRFDVGLGLRIGAEFNHKVSTSLGYDFGLNDIAKDVKAKNRNFYISLGYKF